MPDDFREVQPTFITLAVDRLHRDDVGGEHVTGFCRACANAYLVLNMTLVDTEWSCHPTPDGGRWYRFHDKNSVHMDGCHRVFVLSFSPEREVTDA